MRILTDGFEAQETELWDSADANWTRQSGVWQTIYPRSGLYMLTNNNPAATWETLQSLLPGGIGGTDKLYMRVCFACHSPTVSELRIRWGNHDGGAYGQFLLKANGTRGHLTWGSFDKHISMFDWSADTWHVLEIMATLDAGLSPPAQVTIRLDTVQIWTKAADWSVDWAALRRFEIGHNGHGASDAWAIDDIAVQDDSGAYNNSWPGKTRLVYSYPTADGTYHPMLAGGSTGAPPHYSNLDELAPVDTDYLWGVSGGSVPQLGNETLVHLDPPIPGNATIRNLIPTLRGRIYGEGVSAVVKAIIFSGGSVCDGGSWPVTATWEHRQHAFPVNCYTGESWTQKEARDAEYGFWLNV